MGRPLMPLLLPPPPLSHLLLPLPQRLPHSLWLAPSIKIINYKVT
jgi:hypothetical protein